MLQWPLHRQLLPLRGEPKGNMKCCPGRVEDHHGNCHCARGTDEDCAVKPEQVNLVPMKILVAILRNMQEVAALRVGMAPIASISRRSEDMHERGPTCLCHTREFVLVQMC